MLVVIVLLLYLLFRLNDSVRVITFFILIFFAHLAKLVRTFCNYHFIICTLSRVYTYLYINHFYISLYINLYVYTLLFYKERAFSTQPQCYLTFSNFELQILHRCRLIHKSIIILRHFLYLLYLCPCLDLGLFMSYLCDLFFIFVFIFSMVDRIIS